MLNGQVIMPKPSIMEAADIECKAQLQRFLSDSMPNYIPALDFAILDGGVVNIELAERYIPKDSFRYAKALATIPKNLQTKSILKCAIKVFQTYPCDINREGPTRMICCRPDRERSEMQAQLADVDLICFTENPEIYAVVPATHLYGGYPSGVGLLQGPLACSKAFATRSLRIFLPYIVRRYQLASFLQEIYNRSKSTTFSHPIKNPTTGFQYDAFHPSLGNLTLLAPPPGAILPNTLWAHITALHAAFDMLHSGFKITQSYQYPFGGSFHLSSTTTPSSPSKLRSRFGVKFQLKAWQRTLHQTIQMQAYFSTGLDTQIPIRVFHYGTTWHYLLAESSDSKEALFLPRDCIPKGWWEHDDPSFEIGIDMWEDFLFPLEGDWVAVARKMADIVTKFGKPQSPIPDPPEIGKTLPLADVVYLVAGQLAQNERDRERLEEVDETVCEDRKVVEVEKKGEVDQRGCLDRSSFAGAATGIQGHVKSSKL